MVVFEILTFMALTRLLVAIDKPFLCSGFYAVACFVLGLVWIIGVQERSFLILLRETAIGFGFSSLYFWLLYRIGQGFLWWVVVILGAATILGLDIVLA
jgi:hypothetical protein